MKIAISLLFTSIVISSCRSVDTTSANQLNSPIEFRSHLAIEGSPMGLDVSDDGMVAYVAAGANGLVIIDTSDPLVPRVFHQAAMPGLASDVDVSSGLAYVTLANYGLAVTQVSDPLHPTIASATSLRGTPRRIMRLGDRGYVAAMSAGIRIVDLTSISRPNELGYFEQLPTQTRDVFVDASQELVYVAAGGLRVIDVRNVNSPVARGRYDTSDFVNDIACTDESCYLAVQSRGVHIVSVVNPASLFVKHVWSSIRESALAIAVQDPFVFVIDGRHGIAMLRENDANQLTLVDYANTQSPGFEFDDYAELEIRDRLIYAVNRHGLWIFEFDPSVPDTPSSPTPGTRAVSNCPSPREPGVYLFPGYFGPAESCYFTTSPLPNLRNTPLEIDGKVRIGTVCIHEPDQWFVTLHRLENFLPSPGHSFPSCSAIPHTDYNGMFQSVWVEPLLDPIPSLNSPTPTAQPVTSTSSPSLTPTPRSTPTLSATPTASYTVSPQPTITMPVTSTVTTTLTATPTATLPTLGCTTPLDAVCFCQQIIFGEPCLPTRSNISDFENSPLGSTPLSLKWSLPVSWVVELFAEIDFESPCGIVDQPVSDLSSMCPAGVRSAKIVTPTPIPSETSTSTSTYTPVPTATSTSTSTLTPQPTSTPTSTITPLPTNPPCMPNDSVVFWREFLDGPCIATKTDIADFSSTNIGETGAGFVCAEPSDGWMIHVFPAADYQPNSSSIRVEGCRLFSQRVRSARVARRHTAFIPFTLLQRDDVPCIGDLHREREPNDTIFESDTVGKVCPDSRIEGRLLDEDGLGEAADIFKLQFTKAGRIRLAVDKLSSVSEWSLDFREAHRDVPFAVATRSATADRTELDVEIARFGDFYGGLVPSLDNVRSDDFYWFRWSYDWLTGEREPNDWPEALDNERAIGHSIPAIRGRFFSQDLEDASWCQVAPFDEYCKRGELYDLYKFIVPEDNRILEVSLQRPPVKCGFLRVIVRDENSVKQTPLCESALLDNPTHVAHYENLSPGRYYFQISHYTAGSQSCTWSVDGESRLYYSLEWSLKNATVCSN